MELAKVYILLIIFLVIIYGVPFIFFRGKGRIYLTLGIGCIMYYLIGAIFTFTMTEFQLDNGNYPFVDNMALVFYISLPFILISNLIIGLLFYFFIRLGKDKIKDSD